jgi:peptide/nickel transport system substrate-binding protein
VEEYVSSRHRPSLSTYAPVLAAAGAALAVTLAACSGGGPAPRASDVTPVKAAGLRDGGTLKWAVDAVPATFNVFQTDATDDSALVADAVLPTLFVQDDHARPSPDRDYLTGADVTAGSPQTVVYHLNPAAVWSDGTPLSAADFAAQWHALGGQDSRYWSARTDGYDAISAVTAGPGPHDVTVAFAHPYAPWRHLFTPLYPAAAMSSPAAFSDGSRGRLAATAGPFQLAEVTGQDVTVTRNPHWWGARPHLDAVDFTAVPAAQRPAGLSAGTLDVADVTGTVLDGGRSVAVPGVTVHRAAGPAYLQLTFNGGSGPLADPDVRRALATALDRQRIADTVLKPLGLPPLTLGNHLVMADQPGYQDDSSALGGGQGTATHLLDAAGWTAVDGHGDAAGQGAVRAKDGRPLNLTLLLPAGSATDAEVGSMVARQLSAVGVATRTTTVPPAHLADQLAAGSFDMALFAWPASRYPVADERALFAKPQVGPDGTTQNGQNVAATGTDEIDQLLARSAAALDAKDAARLAAEADTRIWQEAPSVPLFQRPELVAVRDTVAGAGAFGFATPRFQEMAFTRTPVR